MDAGTDAGRRRQQAQGTLDEGGLAGAGLAHQRHHLARLDLHADALDGGSPGPPSGPVVNGQVRDPQERLGCGLVADNLFGDGGAHRRWSFLREVLIRWVAITTRASAMPGRMEIHGCTAK